MIYQATIRLPRRPVVNPYKSQNDVQQIGLRIRLGLARIIAAQSVLVGLFTGQETEVQHTVAVNIANILLQPQTVFITMLDAGSGICTFDDFVLQPSSVLTLIACWAERNLIYGVGTTNETTLGEFMAMLQQRAN